MLVQAVLDYRGVKQAVDWLNSGRQGAEQLQKHPELATLLVEIHRAQMGANVTLDAIIAAQPEQAESI